MRYTVSTPTRNTSTSARAKYAPLALLGFELVRGTVSTPTRNTGTSARAKYARLQRLQRPPAVHAQHRHQRASQICSPAASAASAAPPGGCAVEAIPRADPWHASGGNGLKFVGISVVFIDPEFATSAFRFFSLLPCQMYDATSRTVRQMPKFVHALTRPRQPRSKLSPTDSRTGLQARETPAQTQLPF